MSNIFYDLDKKSFNTTAIAPCVLNELIGYRVEDKQEIRELVDSITFKVVERDATTDLKTKFGDTATTVGAHFDLAPLRHMQEDIVNALDNRAKQLMISIYNPESGVPFEAMIDSEMRNRLDLLAKTPTPTSEDKGSQQLKAAIDGLVRRKQKSASTPSGSQV